MSNITILFNTYPVAFDCPGGGEVQLLKYMEHLEQVGVHVLRYDPWRCHEQFDQADVVHYFSVQGGSWRFCGHVREVRGLPLVISPIIWIDDPAKYGMADIASTLAYATRILPNSQAECDQLARLFKLPHDRFTPIVNGVDDVFFEPVAPALFRQRFGIDEPFVLCMGNIERRKNQLRLIEALRENGIHLVLAGQEREADYAVQCRALADKTVHFVGKLEHGSQLQRSAYAAAEMLVLPSTLETPGLAALEAAAVGTRLALTEIGCTREYFQSFAHYLDPYDGESIRNAITQALATPKNPQLSVFIKENYTWKKAALQLLTVYRHVLEPGTPEGI